MPAEKPEYIFKSMRFHSGTRRALSRVLIVLALALTAATRANVADASFIPALPDKLSDADYWKLITDISEPGGYFRIVDNFTSNEREIGQLFTQLRATHVIGDVYIGVGPEQNLSYIAAIRPKMAFIIDIRRQAVMQHLMFKALFEMSKDRAEFISLLFGIKPTQHFDSLATIQTIWDGFARSMRDSALSAQTQARVLDRLQKTHGFKLTPEEVDLVTKVINAFQTYGPDISTQSGTNRGGGRGGFADTFRTLTGYAYDANGVAQSFLTTEENFQYVKSLHEKNLFVPVSGDFGGPKALRGIGAYIKEHGGVVRAFYLSNVEQYLFQDGKNAAFYDNVATLPVDSASVFIRPYSMRRGGVGAVLSLCPIAAFIRTVAAGKIYANSDALACPVAQ